jgi:hypothetical protein
VAREDVGEAYVVFGEMWQDGLGSGEPSCPGPYPHLQARK